jgi:hypothetical protein
VADQAPERSSTSIPPAPDDLPTPSPFAPSNSTLPPQVSVAHPQLPPLQSANPTSSVSASPLHAALGSGDRVQSSSSTAAPAQILGRRRRIEFEEGEGGDGAHSDAVGTSSAHSYSKRRRGENMLAEADNGEPSSRAARVMSNGSRAGGEFTSATARKTATGGMHSSRLNGGSGGRQQETYFGHNREEITRILIQALDDLGYHAAADSVCEESGFQVESPDVVAFRHAVLAGDWTRAEGLLCGHAASGPGQAPGQGLVLAPGADRNTMRFRLRQQKFLELLERRETSQALSVLRNELTPLCAQQHQTLHLLSRFLMCQDAEDLKVKADWDGAGGRSRQVLLAQLSGKPRRRNACMVLVRVADNITQNQYHLRLCSRSIAWLFSWAT